CHPAGRHWGGGPTPARPWRFFSPPRHPRGPRAARLTQQNPRAGRARRDRHCSSHAGERRSVVTPVSPVDGRRGATVTLAAGSHGSVDVGRGGTLILTGGLFPIGQPDVDAVGDGAVPRG